MEEQMQMGKSAPTLENPSLDLRGENLEYYKNIEYLKEMTRQANALLDRSNAKYENILDDQKLGYKLRAKSNSDSSRSISPELEGRCRKCGLAHGAANFCIVEKIMLNEKEIEEHSRRSKLSKGTWSYKSFSSMDSRKLLHDPESFEETIVEENQQKRNVFYSDSVNMLDKMTPSQVLRHYEALCFRYGPESGRKFLMATALQHPPEAKIEPWTSPRETYPHKRQGLAEKPKIQRLVKIDECKSLAPEPDHPLCPDVSRDVLKKIETLVQVFPRFQTYPLGREKNWKEVLNKQTPKHDEASAKDDVWTPEHATLHGSSEFELCQCGVHTCECYTKKICTTNKIEKKCNIISNAMDNEEEYYNNYLLTMRKKIWKRRDDKRKETQLMLKDNMKQSVVSRSKSVDYLANCRSEHYQTLKNCISKKVTGYDKEEFDDMIHKLVDMTATNKPIDQRQFDHWTEKYKEQEKFERSDGIDSLPSDIQTDEDSSLFSHQTVVDNNFGRIKPSRIPYAEEVYDSIDNLYDKISRKFEASIRKNCLKTSSLSSYRPKYTYIYSKFNLLKCCNPVFKQIMYQARFSPCSKKLMPYHIRVHRKLKRLEELDRRLQRAERRRSMARGLQLGKKYRRVSTSHKYSPESGYIGFRPHERRMLGNPNRFETLNLAADCAGKPITVRRIHHDFRLMSRMFEDAANTEREDLIDQEMQQRLLEFQMKLYSVELPKPPETNSDTGDETDSIYTHRKSNKEEMQKQQRAKSNLDRTTLAKSYGNMPRHQQARHRDNDKCTDSEDELNTLVPRQNKKERVKPQKSISNSNVKGKILSRKITLTEGSTKKTHQERNSARPVTNLLPPLKKSPPPKAHLDVNNSYGEDEIYFTSESSKIPSILRLKGKTTSGKRHSALTKLPKLKSPVKTRRKSGNKTISNEPGDTSKSSGRGLMRQTSVLDVHVDQKLPLLMDKTKFGRNASDESWSKSRMKVVVDPGSKFQLWKSSPETRLSDDS